MILNSFLQEDQLRDSNDPKYAHLNEPLHVLIEVEGTQSEAYLRLAGALNEIKRYMTPVSHLFSLFC